MKTSKPPARRLRKLGVAALLLFGVAGVGDASVEAGTVPNQFICSHASKRCYQTNGAYKPQYPCAIRMRHQYVGYTGFTESYIHRTCSHTYYVW